MLRLILVPFLLVSLLRAGWPGSLIALAVGCIVASTSHSRFRLRGSFFVLGLLLPSLPLLGANICLAVVFTFLVFSTYQQVISPTLRWASPFILALSISALSLVALSCDLTELRAIGLSAADRVGGAKAILHWAHEAPAPWMLTLEALARWVLLFSLISFLWSGEQLRRHLSMGVSVGALLALLLSSMQVYGLLPDLFINQNSYWDGLGRFTGTFSDPNAFGIFAGLLLPIAVIGMRSSVKWVRAINIVVLVWTLALAPFAGSRSYFLALFFYFAFWTWQYKRRYFYAGLLAGICSVVALNVWHLENADQFSSQLTKMPTGIRRVIETFDLSTTQSQLFSRQAFSRIGWAVFKDHPLYGVGLNTFRNYVPSYAKQLALGIGAWTDNPNNFYLGLLAELGLFGILALLGTLSNVRTRPGAEFAWRAGVYCLAVLLLFGPHLDFTEVTVLAALLVSSAFEPNSKTPRVAHTVLALIFGAIGVFYYAHLERGVYAWEKGPDGSLVRWTERTAQINLTCDSADKAHLELQFMHPGLGGRSVNAMVTSPFDGTREFTLQSPETIPFEFSCSPKAQELSAGDSVDRILVQIELDRAFTPDHYRIGGDRRILGARQVGE